MPENNDVFGVAQQVQGICSAYMRLRDENDELRRRLDTVNEDNRRLQKMISSMQDGAKPSGK